MVKSIFVWFAELTIECVLGAYVLFVAFGSNRRGAGVLENVQEDAGPVLIFVLASGYFATSAWFEVLKPRESAVGQICTNVVLFCAHAGGFLILIGAHFERILDILSLGIGAVIFASLIGGSIRKLDRNRIAIER